MLFILHNCRMVRAAPSRVGTPPYLGMYVVPGGQLHHPGEGGVRHTQAHQQTLVHVNQLLHTTHNICICICIYCIQTVRWALHCSQFRAGNSLISLKSNERPRANRSGRSEEMSDCEWIAQVAQDKWATVSKLLRWLMTNEQPWAIHSGRSW